MNKDERPTFYADLPVFHNFFDASNPANYHRLPDDWYIAVTDIINSTKAIESGRYRAVNILGASPIVGILNIAGQNTLPYTFGGDGSIFCIPPELYPSAEDVLAATKYISQSEYNLQMRASIIPISFIRDNNHDIRIARYQASKHYIQAIFSGGGVSFADDLTKEKKCEQFQVPTRDTLDSVDFSGLECRWKEVEQDNNEIITLLVKSNPHRNNESRVYKSVLREMEQTFQLDESEPIKNSNLSMDTSIPNLMREVKIRTAGKGIISRLWYILKMEIEILLGKLFMAFNFRSSQTDWSMYKPDIASNTDHRKFDDMLRVVISGSRKERKTFQEFLENKHQKGELAYGMHISDAAVITCMVFQYHREHVHFIDGKNGGYVNASKRLKQRMDNMKDDDNY